MHLNLPIKNDYIKYITNYKLENNICKIPVEKDCFTLDFSFSDISIESKEFKLVQRINPQSEEIENITEYNEKIIAYTKKYKSLVKSLLKQEYKPDDLLIKDKHTRFCKFSLDEAVILEKFLNKEVSGVYLWVEDRKIKYIGRAKNLVERFGPTGYGTIYPRNMFKGGQSTNCKMNLYVKENKDKNISIYFCKTSDSNDNNNEYKELEKNLLRLCTDTLNIQKS